jgi:hypothetical protein
MRARWERHVAVMREKMNAYNILDRKLHSEDTGIDGRKILNSLDDKC